MWTFFIASKVSRICWRCTSSRIATRWEEYQFLSCLKWSCANASVSTRSIFIGFVWEFVVDSLVLWRSVVLSAVFKSIFWIALVVFMMFLSPCSWVAFRWNGSFSPVAKLLSYVPFLTLLHLSWHYVYTPDSIRWPNCLVIFLLKITAPIVSIQMVCHMCCMSCAWMLTVSMLCIAIFLFSPTIFPGLAEDSAITSFRLFMLV